ncbi:MAG: UDP-N-acetylmuramoyl-L-alanine--D-glutamate ligase [Deltaproteobacteria bacterium]|nr:UDP-N-acetylmuramoyl-L-alanine--D-glutamate ligase [Deltaproteobacteria bacterium]
MKKKLIAGLGITGRELLRYFSGKKIPCVGFEELSEQAVEECRKEFSIECYFEKLPQNIWDEVDECFISPGVPPTRPWVQEALDKGIPVTGELEFASRHLQGSLLAVTGTNGKSTTVSLIHEILKEGGNESGLKGNIGSPLITAVTEPPKDFYVVEVSSYQLETVAKFHPRIAVVLNVTADHLDRYAGMEAYAEAKGRITLNQGKEDYLIVNADDPACTGIARGSKATVVPFSLVNHQKVGGFVDRNEMVIRLHGKEWRYPLDQTALSGLHNQENMLASILAATMAGAKEEAIRSALKKFKPLRHRLELAGEWKGIRFYDDSKGTNVGSVVMSLASFDGNVILILGGRDKGGNYSPLKPLIRHKAKGVIVLGEAVEKIMKALSGDRPFYAVPGMKEALKKSFEIGAAGDVVLLSPACSSFDQYKNYAERGDDFKKWAAHYGQI